MNQVIIGLGSNIDPETHIDQSRKLLGDYFEIIKASSFSRTKPVGPISNQPDFLNGSVLIQTPLDEGQVKNILKTIEKELGRTEGGPKFGPRTIDLDITVWNSAIVDQDFYNRDFIRAAALELIPNLKY